MGYIVYRVDKKRVDYPVGYIVDLISYSDRRDVVNALLEKALNSIDSEGVNVVYYLTVRNNIFEKAFLRNGFIRGIHKNYLIFNFRNPELSDYVKQIPNKKMHFQYGDTDWI